MIFRSSVKIENQISPARVTTHPQLSILTFPLTNNSFPPCVIMNVAALCVKGARLSCLR